MEERLRCRPGDGSRASKRGMRPWNALPLPDPRSANPTQPSTRQRLCRLTCVMWPASGTKPGLEKL